MNITTRRMSDAHEEWLAALFGGRMNKGSGNQWHAPMDGRQSSRYQHYAFAWDGKATLSKSVSVSLDMWEKAREQAGAEMPLLPLRFYADERLRVTLDLVVVRAETFADVVRDANLWRQALDAGLVVDPEDQ